MDGERSLGVAMSASLEASDSTGHRFLTGATIFGTLIGLLLVFWPFLNYMAPAADIEALSSVTVDLASIPVGARSTIIWRGMPVFIAHRTDEEIRQAQDKTLNTFLYPKENDEDRILDPHWLVVLGIGVWSGPIPLGQKPSDPRGPWGGWWDPFRDGGYDTSGRIRSDRGINLRVPPYAFDGHNHLTIGAKGGPKAAFKVPNKKPIHLAESKEKLSFHLPPPG